MASNLLNPRCGRRSGLLTLTAALAWAAAAPVHAAADPALLDAARRAQPAVVESLTDAGFAGRSGKALVLESFGLAGWGYHARDEYIELDSIVQRIYLMTRMLTSVAASNLIRLQESADAEAATELRVLRPRPAARIDRGADLHV